MQKIANALKKINDFIVDGMAVIAGIILLLTMFLISYSILVRFFAESPMPWVMEVSTYALLYITFLGAPWLLKHNGHVGVDLIVGRLTKGKQAAMELFTSSIGLIVCVVVFWFGLMATLDALSRNIMIINMLAIPRYQLLAVIPLGGFFMVVEFAKRIAVRVQTLKEELSQGSTASISAVRHNVKE